MNPDGEVSKCTRVDRHDPHPWHGLTCPGRRRDLTATSPDTTTPVDPKAWLLGFMAGLLVGLLIMAAVLG